MVAEKSARPRRRSFMIASVLALVVGLFALGAGGAAGANSQAGQSPRPTIVLLHGDWADGSSWTSVIKRLQDRGFTVVAPPNTLRGPSQDAPYMASYLQTIPGPIVLVAHSYGGFVITSAATGNPYVNARGYIDAFVSDENETLAGLTADTGSYTL